MEVAQLLGSQGPWWHQVCRHMDCLSRRIDGPITLFLASSSWQQILFGPSLLLGPFRHFKGPMAGVRLYDMAYQALKWPPRLGSFSVVWCVRHLKGHPGWGPSLLLGISGM